MDPDALMFRMRLRLASVRENAVSGQYGEGFLAGVEMMVEHCGDQCLTLELAEELEAEREEQDDLTLEQTKRMEAAGGCVSGDCEE